MAKGQFKFFFTIFLFLFIVVALLSIYNYFLLDSSIERIRTSLRQVSQSRPLSESEGVSFLLQDLFVSEITDSGIDLQRLVASEAFQSAFSSTNLDSRKSEVSFLLKNILSNHEEKRSPVLRTLDKTAQFFYERFFDGARFAQYLSDKFTKSGTTEKVLEEAAMSILGRARDLELQWKFKDAATLYERFLTGFPNYQNYRLIELNLSAVYLRAGRFDDAKRLIAKVPLESSAPNQAKLILLLQRKIHDMEKLNAVREQLINEIAKPASEETSSEKNSSVVSRLKEHEDKTQKRSPANLNFEVGVISLQLFDLENAQSAFEKVIALTSDEEEGKKARWILGWIHLLKTDYTESKRLMAELLEKFPTDPLYTKMSSFTLAALAERSGDATGAIKDWERLSADNAWKDAAFLLKFRTGNAYLYDLNDLSNALTQFNEAQKLAPTPFLSQALEQTFLDIQASSREKAFQKLLQGEIKTARKLFEDVLAVNPGDAWSQCGYGITLHFDGEKAKGLDETVSCRNIQKDPFTNSALAFLNEKEGKNQAAIALYREAIEERKDFVPALYNLGTLELRTGEWQAAAEHLREAKRQVERFRRYNEAYSNNLALAYYKLNRKQEAEIELLTALEWNPNSAEARNNLDQFHAKEGKPSDLPKPVAVVVGDPYAR